MTFDNMKLSNRTYSNHVYSDMTLNKMIWLSNGANEIRTMTASEDRILSHGRSMMDCNVYTIGRGRSIHARLAQSVERWTLNPTVVGSSPTLGEYF